jgi:hypothetical protein
MKFSQFFGRPEVLRAFHGWSILMWGIVWIFATVPAIDWVASIRFISHVTMATALLTSFAAWCASRVEVKQDEQMTELSEANGGDQ